MEPNLVILAGGISSRMKKSVSADLDPHLAKEVSGKSKSMLGVGSEGRPFLDYLLLSAWRGGHRDVVIVVSEKDDSIRSHYADPRRTSYLTGLRITFAIQPIPVHRTKPLGTADALMRGLHARPDWKGQHVTSCNSDNLYSPRAFRMMLDEPSGCAMADYDRDALKFVRSRVEQFGVVVKDERGAVTDIIEKPTADDVKRAADKNGRVGVSMNLWRFPYDRILPCLEEVPLNPVRQEKELPTAVLLMLRRWPGTLVTLPIAEHVPDLTDRGDIESVKEYLDAEFPDLK
jgi:bifunctional N-acetylglucosamine-1-phosphate-uridyltransferase/glucosamine-1-phosphate-acetyltransferase GlmU-like protein